MLSFNVQELAEIRSAFSIAIAVAIPILFCLFTWHKRKAKRLPGPSQWDLSQVNRDNYEAKLDEWAKKYGGVYAIKYLGTRIVVMSDPKLVLKVLRSRPSNFQRTPRLKTNLNGMGFDGLFLAEGETWSRQRRLTAPAFNHQNVKRMVPAIVAVLRQAIECLTQDPGVLNHPKKKDDDGHTDALSLTNLFTISVIAKVAFGIDLNAFDKGCEQLEDLQFFMSAVEKRLRSKIKWHRIPLLSRLLPLERKLAFHKKRYSTFQKDLLEKHIRQQESETSDSPRAQNSRLSKEEKGGQLIQQMIRARASPEEVEATGKAMLKLTEDEILGNIQTIFLAGMETTSNTLAFALYEVAQRPEIQEKLYKEAKEVMGPSGGYPESAEQVENLKYSLAVFQEAVRRHGPGAWLLHTALKDTDIGGYHIPKNGYVGCLLRYQDHSEERYPDPERFIPERWLQKDEKHGSKDENAKGFPGPEVFQFGYGPRTCPGKGFALNEATIFLSVLFYNFKIQLPSNHPQVGREIKFVARPNRKISLIVSKRSD